MTRSHEWVRPRCAAPSWSQLPRRGAASGILCVALLVGSPPTVVRAAGVVGTGTPESCTERTLDGALAGGDLVTFNCGAEPVTITLTSTKTIAADTTIDGGSLITISGGNRVGVFSVNTGVRFTVQNLTIANGNSASYGGGIASNGTLTLTNCTFSGNSASILGGGIVTTGGAVVTNSTFSGNSAGISGGGIWSGGDTVTVTNTIVANSLSGGNCGGSITYGGHNIDDGKTCGFTGTHCDNSTGSSFCNTNPEFDPAGLASNGGPTQTIALQATSAAVDGGDETVCSMTTGAAPVNNLDQRGVVRPGAGHTHCSIGAYEFNSPSPPCVGDCGGDGAVAINEIITMVNIALGNTELSPCTAGDANGDGEIAINEIIAAVNNGLNEC